MIENFDNENINDIRVKMIDFGMSKYTNHGEEKINLNTFAGTLDYMAPEVIEGKDYDNKCDLWSIGVIAFFMLCGKPPFMGRDDVDLCNKIITCNFKYKDPVWSQVSNNA